MISVKVLGSFKNTESFLKKAIKSDPKSILDKYGRLGVRELSAVTPVDTGKTANSWSYEIEKTSTGYALYFNNDNIPNGIPVAILLQYGHATKNGGWVEGIDYINPALKPVFEKMATDLYKKIR